MSNSNKIEVKDYKEYLRDDLLSSDSPLLDYEFTDSLDYDGKYEVDAQPVLTGGIVRTSKTNTRTQMSNVEPRTYNLNAPGSQHQGLYILQDGVCRIMLDENTLAFFRPSDGLPSGAIYGLGTNLLVLDTGDEQFNFDTNLYPTSDGFADLGMATNQWKDIYLVNAPIVSSDVKFKKEIKDLEYGINEIMKLNPISYKRDGSDQVHLGFSAQEVKDVMPEIIREEEGRLSMAYDEIIPALVNAVRDLKVEIDEMRGILMV